MFDCRYVALINEGRKGGCLSVGYRIAAHGERLYAWRDKYDVVALTSSPQALLLPSYE